MLSLLRVSLTLAKSGLRMRDSNPRGPAYETGLVPLQSNPLSYNYYKDTKNILKNQIFLQLFLLCLPEIVRMALTRYLTNAVPLLFRGLFTLLLRYHDVLFIDGVFGGFGKQQQPLKFTTRRLPPPGQAFNTTKTTHNYSLL